MNKSWLKFTAGERRGMIAILIILVAIVLCLYFTRSSSIDSSSINNDTIATSLSKAIENDSINKSSTVKKKRKKRERNNIQKNKTYPTRDPLSEPVPIE